MGLLDGILGNVVGSVLGGGASTSTQNPLGSILNALGAGDKTQTSNMLTAVMSLLQKNGGLGGVLDMFRGGGMTKQADSWVSTGANLPISGDQVQKVFSASSLGSIASQFGMSQGQATSAIAQLLPELINQLTPEGKLPENHADLLSKGLAMLGGGLN